MDAQTDSVPLTLKMRSKGTQNFQGVPQLKEKNPAKAPRGIEL